MLVIGTTGTETPFLSESELPECARLSGPKSEAESSSVIEMEDRELARALQESAAPVDPNAIAPTDKFTEKQVQDLISLGFQRAQVHRFSTHTKKIINAKFFCKVMEELRRFNGDTTQATAALFAKSLKF